ncbi:MAG: hypothetical protein FWE22_04225 [Firmicutes bacterium]|nr:hypothetical protein [Bacillota bacterium]
MFKKLNKLTRDEVIDAMLDLNEKEYIIEHRLKTLRKDINVLMERGKTEDDRSSKILLAKRINILKEEKETLIEQAMFIMYNLQLLGKLKNAIDNKNFTAKVGSMKLNNMLSNHKDLAKFLNKALKNKIKEQDILTKADAVFNKVGDAFGRKETIYGVNAKDEDLLKVFETIEEESDAVESSASQNNFNNIQPQPPHAINPNLGDKMPPLQENNQSPPTPQPPPTISPPQQPKPEVPQPPIPNPDIDKIFENNKLPPLPPIPEIPPQPTHEVEVFIDETTIRLLPNSRPKLEFGLSKNFEKVYLKIDCQHFMCQQRVNNYISDEITITTPGDYQVEVFSRGERITSFDIKITKGMEEKDFGL